MTCSQAPLGGTSGESSDLDNCGRSGVFRGNRSSTESGRLEKSVSRLRDRHWERGEALIA